WVVERRHFFRARAPARGTPSLALGLGRSLPAHEKGILPHMADRFYTNSPLAPGPFVLQGAEAHHLATVRRFRAGDRVCLFNGDGHEYPAEVVATNKKSVAL